MGAGSSGPNDTARTRLGGGLLARSVIAESSSIRACVVASPLGMPSSLGMLSTLERRIAGLIGRVGAGGLSAEEHTPPGLSAYSAQERSDTRPGHTRPGGLSAEEHAAEERSDTRPGHARPGGLSAEEHAAEERSAVEPSDTPPGHTPRLWRTGLSAEEHTAEGHKEEESAEEAEERRIMEHPREN